MVYEAVEEEAVNAGLPLHELPKEITTAGKGRAIRSEQAEVLQKKERAWAAVRGEQRSQRPRERLIEGEARRL